MNRFIYYCCKHHTKWANQRNKFKVQKYFQCSHPMDKHWKFITIRMLMYLLKVSIFLSVNRISSTSVAKRQRDKKNYLFFLRQNNSLTISNWKMDCPINSWWREKKFAAETSSWDGVQKLELVDCKKNSKLAVNCYFGLFVELDEDIIIKSRFAEKAHWLNVEKFSGYSIIFFFFCFLDKLFQLSNVLYCG